MEKKNYLLNVIEYVTLIILFMLGDSNKLFTFTLCYLFYKVLSSVYNNVNIKDSILKYKNKDSVFRNKGYIYSIILVLIYGIFGLGISFLLSILIDNVFNIDKIVIPLVITSIVTIFKPILNITYSLLQIYNKKKLANSIHYIYYGVDSILTIIIYLIINKMKIASYLFTSILFIPKIISFFIVISLCMMICFRKNGKNKYTVSEFREVVNDFNKSLTVVDSTKYGYFYISFIILYMTLVNRKVHNRE